jgi:CelD/BcsL family acetyltransferase involved in cellulose biosynthesis
MGLRSSRGNALKNQLSLPRESDVMSSVANISIAGIPLGSFVMGSECGGLEVIDRWAEEWRNLCYEAVEDQPFYRPEWIRAYFRKYGKRGKVRIITARLRGRLCLLLPLLEQIATFSKVPVRRFRSPVNAICGRFDGVRCAGPEGDAAVRATWIYLKQLDGWDLLQFRDALEGSTVSEIAAAARADGFLTVQESDRPSPYVPVPDDPASLMKMPPNAKLRSQLRQARRRLAEKGAVNFYRVQTADRDALDRFYRLEASGWKGKIRSCALYDGSKPFYDEVAESAALFGYFSLYMLELNGQLIAAHFSLTHRGRCYSPKVAYDESFKLYAPGHLIVGEILQDCVARGITCYDITGQDQDWKMKWTSAARPVNHYFIFKGRLGNMAHSVGTRFKPAVGRLLPAKLKTA